jgi:DNA repair protein SbcD/Mre11
VKMMKILHTGDWHIGKMVNDFSMLEDQAYILNKLFTVIELEQPDVLVISGDIYDRSIPPKEAVELLNTTLTTLIETYKIPTLLISGNHDSAERLSFGNKLLEHKQLYIEGCFDGQVKKVILEDAYGPVNFYLIPYIHPSLAKHLLNDDSITDHQSTLEHILNHCLTDFNPKERNMLINHNYVAPSQMSLDESESERSLSIGGAEIVDCELFKKFDYCALGHLHKPQKVKYNHIRYSGSLLKYSFSEVGYKKGVYLIELKEKGNQSIRFIELEPIRDLIKIKGSLKELTSASFYQTINRNDYISAILTDEGDLYDPIASLRAIYPNIMQIERNQTLIQVDSQNKAKGNFKEKTKLELFDEFYETITQKKLTKEELDIVVKVIEEVIKGGDASCD